MGNLCCAREHSVQFLVQFFYTVKTAQFNLGCMGPLWMNPVNGTGNELLSGNFVFLSTFLKYRCLLPVAGYSSI